MSSNLSEYVLGIFQTLVTSYDEVELEGVKYCQEKQPFAHGSYGEIYRIYPRNSWGMPDKTIPLAAKYHTSEADNEETLPIALAEAEKHQLLFDNKVYQLKSGQVVTLMPLFPGKPIFRYDGVLQQGTVHEKLAALTISQRFELCALVAQTYAEFYANRLDRDGLQHPDLKPENILIEIKIDKKGRAFFQCNIIDFGDIARTVATQAPEDFGPGHEHDSRMAVYSLTTMMAVILGETTPYEYKKASLSLGINAPAPFYLENMKKFLPKAMKPYQNIALENIVDAVINIAKSMAIMPKEASSEILLKIMTPKELIIEVMVAMTNKMGSFNLDFLYEKLDKLTPQNLIKEFVINVLMCMSAQEPEDRPELLAIAQVFNTLALELRRCDYAAENSQQDKESSGSHKVMCKESIIPIRNHLLTHSLAAFFSQNVEQSSSSEKGGESFSQSRMRV